MRYRREIDGLRALAVIPVILFHAGFTTFGGGFVGVDVFFVISGYLITGIILEELDQGGFSLINFYERRARRILPPLFLISFACIPFVWLWLLPQDLEAFAQSLIAVLAFASNILFWKTSGYFNVDAELAPLLHTWSLAVEEQFYILFPLFLLLLHRFDKRWLAPSLLLIFIVSFVVLLWGSQAAPVATFYLLPARAWELIAGAIVALAFQHFEHRQPGRLLAEAGSLTGVALILYAILVFDRNTATQAIYAPVVVLGAVLVISCASEKNLVGAWLGSGLMVGIGLISYGAYLIHHPMLAFARYGGFDEPGALWKVFLIIATLLLAYLSWRFIEMPLRRNRACSGKRIVMMALLASSLLALAALYGVYGRGLPDRHGFEGAAELVYGKNLEGWSGCQIVTAPNPEKGGCLVLNPNKPVDILVVGDSHGGHLASGLRHVFTDSRHNAAILIHAGCYPVYSFAHDDGAPFKCPGNLINNALDHARNTKSIKTVMLVGYPALHLQENRLHEKTPVDRVKMQGNVESLENALSRTLSLLLSSGKRVIFLLDNPEQIRDPKRCVLHKDCDISISRQQYLERNRAYLQIADRLRATFPEVILADASKAFCDATKCYGARDGALYYATRDHLTPAGSIKLTQTLNLKSLLAGEND